MVVESWRGRGGKGGSAGPVGRPGGAAPRGLSAVVRPRGAFGALSRAPRAAGGAPRRSCSPPAGAGAGS